MVVWQDVLHVQGLVVSTRKLLGIQSLPVADGSVGHYYVVLVLVLLQHVFVHVPTARRLLSLSLGL
jgi:hypothetical protein